MIEAILAAVITAAATVAAQLFISRRERESRERSLIEQNSRMERLEAAVEKQSGLFERIYKTEADMAVLKSRIDSGNIRC